MNNRDINPKVTKIFRVRKTVFKMLVKRGYAVSEEEMNMNLNDFVDKYCEVDGSMKMDNLSIPARKIDDDSDDRLVVIFIRSEGDKKISAKDFEARLERMELDGYKRVIVVLGGVITSDGKKKLSGASSGMMIVESFTEDELVVDITEHELVPEHQLLTLSEKAFLLKQYGLEERQLPRIQKRDPIARYFGAQKGQVFRIVRKSETAGKYVTYRIVDS